MLENWLRNIPPVVKNIAIICVLMGLATWILQGQNIDLRMELSLYYPDSPHFRPYQIVTHMFMHGSLGHLFFNMLALLMLGSWVERALGSKRFFIFYFITGFGALFCHVLASGLEVYNASGTFWAYSEGAKVPLEMFKRMGEIYGSPVLGASGAVFGVLIAFGMLFPNQELFIFPIPFPLKAKYFIPLLIIAELYLSQRQFSWDNIAHYAHLGGALAGFILMRFWRNKVIRF